MTSFFASANSSILCPRSYTFCFRILLCVSRRQNPKKKTFLITKIPAINLASLNSAAFCKLLFAASSEILAAGAASACSSCECGVPRVVVISLSVMAIRSPYFTRLRTGEVKKPFEKQTRKRNVKASDMPKPKIKQEYRDENDPGQSTTPQKNTKSPVKSIKLEPQEDASVVPKSKWEPLHWRMQLDNIRKMRAEKNAPVDTMGCEKCKGENYSEKDKRFHTLISLMLSSQTKDHITHGAMLKLIDYGLSADSVTKMADEKLGELIYPVGFWKKKIVYLKKTAEILKNEYDGDIPDTVDGLVKLPGVGPKMAYLAMNCAWNKVVGIGVDVHVHRIANRLKWVRKSTTEPEKTRKELEDWLPQSYWKEVNWLLVGFGQQVCLPISPRCSDCLNKDICPSSTAKSRKFKKAS